jgi:hypothetical protein
MLSSLLGDSITKAELSCLDDDSLSITVQFNPTSFKLGRKVNWAEQKPALQPWGTLQYGNGACDTMQVSLLIDESETEDSVLPAIEGFYELTMPLEISSNVIRPPCVVFKWEEFKFQGVVSSLDVEILLFDDAGAAKRAMVTMSLLGRAFAEASSSDEFFSQTYSP